MAIADCTYDTPGRFIAVALVLADSCGAPICGPDTGWVDHCMAALALEDDLFEGDDFDRTCADGSLFVSEPGPKTLKGVDFELDLHGADPDFLAQATGGRPISQDGTVVGWGTATDIEGSLNIYLWRQVAGEGACDPLTGDPRYVVTVLPWAAEVMVTDEGDFGSAESFIRLTGTSRGGHNFGVGGLNLFDDGTGTAECMEEPVPANEKRLDVFSTLPPPTDCGLIDVDSCDCLGS